MLINTNAFTSGTVAQSVDLVIVMNYGIIC